MVLLAKPLSYLSLDYEKSKENQFLLVPKTKKSLLDASVELGIPLKDLKKSYQQGLNLLLTVIECFKLFEKYENSIHFCTECGKLLTSNILECKHDGINYLDLWDREIEYFDYLNFMSFERFLLLKVYKPECLDILKNHGKKLRGKSNGNA